MLEPLSYTCPHCAQVIETAADPSQGASQQYIEDCQVCCRPLRLQVVLDEDGRAWADATPEDD
jgi:hypothetical protein